MFKKWKALILIAALSSSVVVAMQNCGEMRGAGDFSMSSQLQLSHDHPSTQKVEAKSEVQPLFANRMLVYNTLIDIFGTNRKQDFIERVAWASNEMGSSFSLYNQRILAGSDCSSSGSPYYKCKGGALDITTPSVIGVSAPREARRIRVCYIATKDNKTFRHALRRIQTSASLEDPPPPTRDNYERVFRLFFRGRPLPGESYFDSLKLQMEQAESPLEGWRSILHSLCLSPHWQVM